MHPPGPLAFGRIGPVGEPLSALLAAVAGGDQDALRVLYERQARRLFGIANTILRDPDLAADAVQDAFLRVSQRAAQFDPARGEASAWLGGIARYAALDIARRRGREVPTDDPALGDGAAEPDALEHAAKGQAARHLRDSLRTLEESQRASVLPTFVHGLSHVQLAERLKLPVGTVKSNLRRTLDRLRKSLP
jgi:RNA polymerase sigma-70 factor (ECF subfamily)